MNENAAPKSPRRSFLFTPGDSIRKLRKATRAGADAVILDLEDGVAANKKEQARQNVIAALTEMDFGRSERLVRLNQPGTEFYVADLKAIAETEVDGIVLPKVESAGQLRQVEDDLSTVVRADHSIGLFALIETALGIVNVAEISRSSTRMVALLFGAEDLASDLGARRTSSGWEIFHGRSAVVTAAAAYELEAIDTVYVSFRDLTGLEEDAAFARGLGFSGKLAIHPQQVDILNRAFSPSKTEIAQAERVLQAYKAHLESGAGVFVIDDRMVDLPHVRAAERLLSKARLAGLTEA